MEQITKRNEAVKDSKQTRMFCYQCQETAGNKGCTVSGMCGKVPEVANMQDLLIYCLLYTSPSPRDRQKSRMPSSA